MAWWLRWFCCSRQRIALAALAGSRDRGEADRARAVLLTLAGWTSPRVAEAFGVREDTVRLWHSDFGRGGVKALKASIAPGPLPVKSETALRVVTPLLDEPVADRSNWTIARLRAEIEAREGVRISRSQLTKALRRYCNGLGEMLTASYGLPMAKGTSRKLSLKKRREPTVAATTSTLTDFITEVTKYALNEARFKCYRGQRDASWENIPGLFRPDLRKLEANERRAIRDLISVQPHEFMADATMFDRLVRMQHFGLPTRLMDVSLNPLVALYFASDPGPEGKSSDGMVTAFAVPTSREKYYDSDAVSCLANLANMTKAEKEEIVKIRESPVPGTSKEFDTARVNGEPVYKRLHQFIRMERPYFLPIIDPIDLFKPYYVHPKMSNKRILSQAGAFIIHGLKPRRSIRFAHVIHETRFIIPKDKKEELREALKLLGITESNLFPEIDKAAKRIEASYSSR